jgi:hypothetical protein
MKWENFSKEERLLICCSRKKMSKDYRLEIKNILSKDVNWSSVLRIGEKHKILSFLYLHFKEEMSVKIPPWVMEILKDFYYRISYRNMRIYSLLIPILKGIQEKNIPIILLKGVALADKVYGNIALRPMYDVDLLVKKEDVEKVGSLFKKFNFLCDLESDDGKSYHNRYFDKDKGIGFELHWNIENTPNPFTLNIDEIWERAQSAGIPGVQALILSPEDLILYLCLHTSYHHKFYQDLITLKQICDISESIRYYQSVFDWLKFTNLAQRYGLSKPVYCSLYITESLLSTGIPLDIIDNLRLKSFNTEYTDFIIRERIFAKNPFPAGIVKSFSGLSMSEKIKAFIKTVFLSPSDMAKRYYLSPKSPKVYLYYISRIYHLFFDYGGVLMKLFARHPRTISELRKEIMVSKRQAEINQWLESVN